MERILIFKDGEVSLEREELELIPAFKPLFTLNYNKQAGDIDGRKRSRVTAEFTYMWFMHSYKTPYREYSEKERHTEALLTAKLDPNYEFSTEYKIAEKEYLRLTATRILRLIQAGDKAVDRLREYLEMVDFNERKDNGDMMHKPTEVIKIISDLDKVADGLESLANRQKREQQEFASTRGAQEPGWVMDQNKTNHGKSTRGADSES